MKSFKWLAVLLQALIILVGCSSATGGSGEKELVLRRSYFDPHGTRSFARTAVALVDDKIVAANIEEFQFGQGGMEFVPNSDAGFGEGYAEGVKLYAKRLNQEAYSKNMEEKAGATKTLLENYQAIEEYVVGKTVAELEELVNSTEGGAPLDAISGSTLVDTHGYLRAIIDAAKNENYQAKGKFSGKVEDIKIGWIQYAAHGDKAFADTVVAVLGDKIVAANLDEFQFLAEGAVAVPNSDKDFGENYAEGRVLASKKVNHESYSKNMEEKAGATKDIAESFAAIEDYVAGKTIADVEKVAVESEAGVPVDAISDSTLVDTKGYLDSIVEAAKNVK